MLLVFYSASTPKELLYNLSAYSANPKTLEELGPPVTHLYEVRGHLLQINSLSLSDKLLKKF